MNCAWPFALYTMSMICRPSKRDGFSGFVIALYGGREMGCMRPNGSFADAESVVAESCDAAAPRPPRPPPRPPPCACENTVKLLSSGDEPFTMGGSPTG